MQRKQPQTGEVPVKSPNTLGMPAHRYRPAPAVELATRGWPNRRIERAPNWCSVDLRDGNQALVDPMGLRRKRRMFEGLVEIGFREIEVGFPAASRTEFDFLRAILGEGLVPDDVRLGVLTQARDEQIDASVDALRGARNAIVHIYNSTSPIQREVVFGLECEQIIALAVRATDRLRERVEEIAGTDVVLEYSPESFSATEPAFAVEICEAVMEAWGASPDRRVILNLPATVEVSTPNLYADQVETFCRNLSDRDHAIISVHPHNDRGCAVAAAELALMAGAERIEGTLFGNGERTGNVDLVTLALNLMSQGVDPGLDLRDLDAVTRLAEKCTRIPVHPRHPYAGELVFTAFSGSHQDAIRKGLAAQERRGDDRWEVPYLPIDPADVGRSYEEVIRINSQSGKGGVAYLMERDHGYSLPRRLQVEFSRNVQSLSEETEKELPSDEIEAAFRREYLAVEGPYALVEFDLHRSNEPVASADEPRSELKVRFRSGEQIVEFEGRGRGPLHAFVEKLGQLLGRDIQVLGFWEHALGSGADARAVAYVELCIDGRQLFGVGVDASILTASLEAVVSALNRCTEPAAAARTISVA